MKRIFALTTVFFAAVAMNGCATAPTAHSVHKTLQTADIAKMESYPERYARERASAKSTGLADYAG